MSGIYNPTPLDPLQVALPGVVITGAITNVPGGGLIARHSAVVQYNPTTGVFTFPPGMYLVGFKNVFGNYAANLLTTWNFGLNDTWQHVTNPADPIAFSTGNGIPMYLLNTESLGTTAQQLAVSASQNITLFQWNIVIVQFAL